MNRTTLFGFLLLAFLVAVVSCSKPPGQAEFDRGLYELKRNNIVRAKALFEKSISRRPGAEENVLAYNYLGIACWKLGQFQAAQEAFEDSRRLGPTLMEPALNLGLLVASSGDLLRAAKLLDEAVQLDKRDTRALEHMARFYAERQQWQEARRILYAALDRAPESPRILTEIANLELEARGPQKAVELLIQALESQKNYASALFNLAFIYDVRLQDAAHARTYYRRFLKEQDNGPQADYARSALARLDTPAPAAIAAPESSVRSAPSTPAPVATTTPAPSAPVVPLDPIVALNRKAAMMVEKGDSSGALDLLLDAASVAAGESRPADQERLVQDAARLCFDQPRAYFELGQLLLMKGKTEDALNAFKKATTLDRNYTAAHLAMARTALRMGETDSALVGFQAAVKADPQNADALWDLAQVFDVRMKNAEGALATYRDFERLFPRDARVLQASERIKTLAVSVRPPAAPTAPDTFRTPAPILPTPKPGTVAPPVVERPRPQAVDPAPQREPAQPAKPAKRVQYKSPLTPNSQAALLAFNQGASYQQQRNWESAIYYYLRSLENDDRLGETFYNLGSAYTARGETELAKDAYLRALELKPSLESARYNLALLYFQGGDSASAEGLLRELVKQNPDYAAAHYTLGLIYSADPATKEQARQAYQRYLDLAPNDPAAASVRKWLKMP